MCLTSFSVISAVFVANIDRQSEGDKAVPACLHKSAHTLGKILCVKMVSWDERHYNVRQLAKVSVSYWDTFTRYSSRGCSGFCGVSRCCWGLQEQRVFGCVLNHLGQDLYTLFYTEWVIYTSLSSSKIERKENLKIHKNILKDEFWKTR